MDERMEQLRVSEVEGMIVLEQPDNDDPSESCMIAIHPDQVELVVDWMRRAVKVARGERPRERQEKQTAPES